MGWNVLFTPSFLLLLSLIVVLLFDKMCQSLLSGSCLLRWESIAQSFLSKIQYKSKAGLKCFTLLGYHLLLLLLLLVSFPLVLHLNIINAQSNVRLGRRILGHLHIHIRGKTHDVWWMGTSTSKNIPHSECECFASPCWIRVVRMHNDDDVM